MDADRDWRGVTAGLDEALDFWFEECQPKQWYQADTAFDQQIADRFGELHAMAKRGELFSQRTSPRLRLGEVIVLDQFSRNIYRGAAEAYASDPLALALAQEVVLRAEDVSLSHFERYFLYMPFMHAESRVIQAVSLRLFTAFGDEEGVDYARRHKDVIDRFGRFPMRNALLGRQSTSMELKYITERDGKAF